jgi:hypothetical protein
MPIPPKRWRGSSGCCAGRLSSCGRLPTPRVSSRLDRCWGWASTWPGTKWAVSCRRDFNRRVSAGRGGTGRSASLRRAVTFGEQLGQVLLVSEGDPAAGGVLVMIDEDWIERQLTMAPELGRARRKNLSRLLATVERSTQVETSSVPSLVLVEPSLLQEPQTEWRAAG